MDLCDRFRDAKDGDDVRAICDEIKEMAVA
jgi:hypothetical protein